MTDHLEADTITIPGQNYALINVVSPKSNQKNEDCGVKIKGVFATLDEAKQYSQKINKIDPTFDLFVVELYKWFPVPPSIEDIQDQKFQDDKLNEIIESHKQEQMKAKEFFEARKEELMKGKTEPNDQVRYDAPSVEEVKEPDPEKGEEKQETPEKTGEDTTEAEPVKESTEEEEPEPEKGDTEDRD